MNVILKIKLVCKMDKEMGRRKVMEALIIEFWKWNFKNFWERKKFFPIQGANINSRDYHR